MNTWFVQYHEGWPNTGDLPYFVRRNDEPDFPHSEWKFGTVVIPSYNKSSFKPLSSEDLQDLRIRVDAQYNAEGNDQ